MDSSDGCLEHTSTPGNADRRNTARKLAQFEEVAGDESVPDLQEALCLFFDLGPSDLEVYTTVLDQPQSTPFELAETLGNDRSLINKRLSTLRDADLVYRETYPLSDGGYEYRYRGQPLTETVEGLNNEIEAWSDEVVTQFQQIQTSNTVEDPP